MTEEHPTVAEVEADVKKSALDSGFKIWGIFSGVIIVAFMIGQPLITVTTKLSTTDAVSADNVKLHAAVDALGQDLATYKGVTNLRLQADEAGLGDVKLIKDDIKSLIAAQAKTDLAIQALSMKIDQRK